MKFKYFIILLIILKMIAIYILFVKNNLNYYLALKRNKISAELDIY